MKASDYFAGEAKSELCHAKKIEDFLVDWNVHPPLPTIPATSTEFKSLPEAIEKAYKIEYDLYEEYEDTSMKVFKTGDLCVFDFLGFYRTTQKESVAEYSDMLNILEGVDDDKFKLLQLEETLFED